MKLSTHLFLPFLAINSFALTTPNGKDVSETLSSNTQIQSTDSKMVTDNTLHTTSRNYDEPITIITTTNSLGHTYTSKVWWTPTEETWSKSTSETKSDIAKVTVSMSDVNTKSTEVASRETSMRTSESSTSTSTRPRNSTNIAPINRGSYVYLGALVAGALVL